MKGLLRDFVYGLRKWHPSWCDCLLCRLYRWLDGDWFPTPPSGMNYA